MDQGLLIFLNNIKQRHPDEKCVCLIVRITIPSPLHHQTKRFTSYLRMFFDDSAKWFLTEEDGYDVLNHMFPRLETNLSDFLEKMQTLNNIGGIWEWIPVNNPEYRYKMLWGGTLPTLNSSKYSTLDYNMVYPEDLDVNF